MAAVRTKIFALILLCGCGSNPWQLEQISTNNPVYDSSRLRYASDSPLAFEMLRIGNEIESYLSLNHARFKDEKIKIRFSTLSGSFEDLALVRAGKMKLRISQEATKKLLEALKAKEAVTISIDDYEETLQPDAFSNSFSKFLGEKNIYEGLL